MPSPLPTDPVDRIAAVEARLARLEDEAEIRRVVTEYGRAIDRNEAAPLARAFHPEASIHYGSDVFEGTGAAFVPAVLAVQASMFRTSHFIGQSHIEFDEQGARAETYSQATHLMESGSATVEFTSGSRYLDTFERHDDRWQIVHRQVVLDWLRELTADMSLFDRIQGPPSGGRGREDPSFDFFGPRAPIR